MMELNAELERLTLTYGQELFARVDRRGPVNFTPAWWDEQLMGFTMGHEAVKLQLFRFIDVLPLLNAPETVARHLREYFEEASGALPTWAHFGLRWLPSRGLGARVLARTARSNAQRMARRFIAGSNLDEALQTVARLRRKQLAFTLDLLGEATITEAEAERCQEAYLHLVEGLSQTVNSWPAILRIDSDDQGPVPRVNVSIKLSALYSQFDPIDPVGTSDVVRGRLRPILQAARKHGAFVNIDMEQHSFKDLTLRIFKEVLDEAEFRDWPDVGIAIQAYLHSCDKDLQELADWARRRGTPVWVRLIKGAYWDYETVLAAQEDWPLPVFRQKWQTDANYERLTLFLLENHDILRPAFGSHNIRSLAHAMAAAQLMGVPENGYEIQMLYGMADPIKDALVNLKQRVRVYTPYGQLLPGMAYLVRRLLENTANDSFLRASFTMHVAEEKLLMNPSEKKMRNGEPRAENGEPADNSRFSVLGSPFIVPEFKNEPLTDFSIEANRENMKAALADVKKQLGQPIRW